MPNLGPGYDLATRIKRLEDRLDRLAANPLGQNFSARQSDGSVGLQIGQDGGTGATAMRFRQGTTTTRDPNTGEHPTLLYIGEVVSGGVYADSAAIFFRPNGSESAVIGNRGVQIIDASSNTVVSSDENSAEGLGRPWIPLPTPASTRFAHWPAANSSSASLMAECFFDGQHPKVYWNASVGGDPGVSGTVQMTISSPSGSVSTASYSYSGTQVDIDETLVLPKPFFDVGFTLQILGSVTGGTGNIYCQTWELVGRQS